MIFFGEIFFPNIIIIIGYHDPGQINWEKTNSIIHSAVCLDKWPYAKRIVMIMVMVLGVTNDQHVHLHHYQLCTTALLAITSTSRHRSHSHIL